MENIVSNLEDFKAYYNREFELFDGEAFITFDIVDVNFDNETITVAITNRGKISVITFELKENYLGYYFEYNAITPNIYLHQFEEVA